jgi:hypothetical protein
MNTSFTATAGVVPAPADQAPAKVAIPQYGIRRILAVWAAAALPMGALAWLVAPALKDSFAGTGNVQMVKALIVCLAAGMIWQFVLVAALLRREQERRRSTTRSAWLRSPLSPRSGAAAQDLADPRPADPRGRVLTRSRTGPATETSPRLQLMPATFLSGAWAGTIDPGGVPVQHRVGEEPFRGFLRARMTVCRLRRLARQLRPVRRIPPARVVGDAVRTARHAHFGA